MNSQFNQLCKELNLNQKAPSEKALAALGKWYFQEVSQDNYTPISLESARDYLDVFLPNIPDNIADSSPALQNMNAIQYAAIHGYDRFIEQLKENKSELLNKSTPYGMTPLHLAASYGHVHEVDVLLEHGASALCKNSLTEYPIHSALFTPVSVDKKFHKRKELIFNALKKAAPETITAKDALGETVAHKMAAHGYKNLLATLIHEQPELILIPDNFSRYPIHLAILNNQLEIVRLLMPVKGVTKLTDSDARGILHYAVSSNKDILQTCLLYYSNVDIHDLWNKTPLHYAAHEGNFPAVIVLIDHGADVHAIDAMGLNILHHAVSSGNINLVSWIMDNLAVDVNMLDNNGYSALNYAKQKGLANIEKLLVEHKD